MTGQLLERGNRVTRTVRKIDAMKDLKAKYGPLMKWNLKKEKCNVRRQRHNSTSSVAAIYTRNGYSEGSTGRRCLELS
jgi:hypothetical protein